MSRERLLIITNLFADPFSPTRATFSQQQFSRLRAHMDVHIVVPVSFIPVMRNLLAWRRLKRETEAKWPGVHYIVYWYVPGVMRGLHSWALMASMLLQCFPTLFLRRWDLILGSWAFPDAVVAAWVGALTRTPVAVHVLGSDINVFTQDSWRRRQILWTLGRAKAVLSVSQALVRKMVGMGAPEAPMRVLYNGVDPERFHPLDRAAARARLGVGADEEMVLFVGNVLVTKGCGELLEAFHALASKRPRLTLTYVGDGPMRAALQARVAELGLQSRVRFAGRVMHDQLNSWFAASTLFCLPSYSEGVPNVVLEAMACARPVVATDVGGIAEVLPPFAGGLIPPKDAPALAQKLDWALGQDWDLTRITAHAATFDWDSNVAQFHQILTEAARH